MVLLGGYSFDIIKHSRGIIDVTMKDNFLKIQLGINGKIPKGYKELIHENTITIPTSTNM